MKRGEWTPWSVLDPKLFGLEYVEYYEPTFYHRDVIPSKVVKISDVTPRYYNIGNMFWRPVHHA